MNDKADRALLVLGYLIALVTLLIFLAVTHIDVQISAKNIMFIAVYMIVIRFALTQSSARMRYGAATFVTCLIASGIMLTVVGAGFVTGLITAFVIPLTAVVVWQILKFIKNG